MRKRNNKIKRIEKQQKNQSNYTLSDWFEILSLKNTYADALGAKEIQEPSSSTGPLNRVQPPQLSPA